jgi:predicted DNA binding CopG/RHH family protein
MKRKIVYTDEPLGRLRVIENFLPPPSELVLREEGVKVTMTLSKSSVDYFKRAAKKYGTPYQTMIRRLVDAYAARHPRL